MTFVFRSPAARRPLPARVSLARGCVGVRAAGQPGGSGNGPTSPPTDSGFSTVGRHRVGSYPYDGNCPWAGIYSR